MDPSQVLALLLIASPLATISALWHRSWSLMALAALLALPLAVVQIPYLVLLLIPCLQLAAAVALRWHAGAVGWLTLLGVALVIGLAGGPGTILLDGNLFWLLLVGLVVGFIALVWERPPWTGVGPHGDESSP